MDRLSVSRRTLVKTSVASVVAAGIAAPVVRAETQATPVTGGPLPLADAFATLSPESVFANFYRLTQIPRPTHHEAAVSAFLAAFGRDLDLETDANEIGNVVIRKPATPGMEERRGVVLQAHMDMVPAKSPDSDHVFETDPIDAYVQDGWMRARDTTLGADDGIGVAMIMAILQADDIEHGPLEALFTVDEEDGFTGANAVGPDDLRGEMLINIDSEEEGVFTIGGAGGVDVKSTMSYTEANAPADFVGARLTVSGLQGGHSGIEIDKGRGNAIKLLARLLDELEREVDLRLATAQGGDRSNAIPRNATALLALPDAQRSQLDELVGAFAKRVGTEFVAADPGLVVAADSAEAPARVMDPDTQTRIIDALNGCPDGVTRMSDSVPGLVETSTNLGILDIGDGSMEAVSRVRSSIDSARDALRDAIVSVFSLAGAESSFAGESPGWPPNPDSPLLALMKQTYFDLFGVEPGVMAVHAGLETGKFAQTYPHMDLISVGPTLLNVHTTEERLDVASVEPTYELLVATLAQIPA